MFVSTTGLICAAALLVLGLAQWAFLKRVLENSRAGLEFQERVRREETHAQLLKVLLVVDVLVLPVVGYFAGQMVFGK